MKNIVRVMMLLSMMGCAGLAGCSTEGIEGDAPVSDGAAYQSTFKLGSEELVVSADTWILDPGVRLTITYRRDQVEETIEMSKEQDAPQEKIGYLLTNASDDFKAYVRQETELRKTRALEEDGELASAESEERYKWAGHTWYILGAGMEEVPQHGSWCDCTDNLSCGLQGKPKASCCFYYLNYHCHCVSSC